MEREQASPFSQDPITKKPPPMQLRGAHYPVIVRATVPSNPVDVGQRSLKTNLKQAVRERDTIRFGEEAFMLAVRRNEHGRLVLVVIAIDENAPRTPLTIHHLLPDAICC